MAFTLSRRFDSYVAQGSQFNRFPSALVKCTLLKIRPAPAAPRTSRRSPPCCNRSCTRPRALKRNIPQGAQSLDRFRNSHTSKTLPTDRPSHHALAHPPKPQSSQFSSPFRSPSGILLSHKGRGAPMQQPTMVLARIAGKAHAQQPNGILPPTDLLTPVLQQHRGPVHLPARNAATRQISVRRRKTNPLFLPLSPSSSSASPLFAQTADPYQHHLHQTSKDFQPVPQDPKSSSKPGPIFIYMPWTYQWTIGYTPESGKWSLDHGYNGAFINREPPGRQARLDQPVQAPLLRRSHRRQGLPASLGRRRRQTASQRAPRHRRPRQAPQRRTAPASSSA